MKNLLKYLNGQHLYLQAEDDTTGASAPIADDDTDVDTEDVDTDDNSDTDLEAKLAEFEARLAEKEKVANKQQAALRRKYERQLKQQTQQIEELKAQLTPTEDEQDKDPVVEEDETKGKTAKQAEARVNRELQQKLRELEKLRSELDAAEARRQQEEQARKELEKKSLLNTAIQKAGVLPEAADVAFAYFKENVVWDETFGEWAYKLDEDNFVPVEEAVTERLPDFLKPRRSRAGSGGGNLGAGNPTSNAGKKELDAARDKLQEIMRDYQANGGRGKYQLKHYHDQKKIIADLEKRSK